ncbi:MAG TPA: hypothetical protein VIJ66_08775 [Solirubrobacteraceae bacterium]
MSDAASTVERDRWDRLPAWLRPREQELAGRGRRRLVEVTLLILAGLLLTVAVVNDLVEQTHVNHRLIADLRTWRQYTGHDYKNLSTEQDIYGHTTRDVICGNTTPGPPGERIQLCLQMTGPVIHGRRAVPGGWYLPPKVENEPSQRYGCYGLAKGEHRCGAAARGSESVEGSSPETSP